MAKNKAPTSLDEFADGLPERGSGNGTSTAQAAAASQTGPIGPAPGELSDVRGAVSADSAVPASVSSSANAPIGPAPGELSDVRGALSPEGAPSGDRALASSGIARTPAAPEGELARQIVAATERPAPPPPVVGPGRYRVSCNPPTPLAHNHIECDAKDENHAWAQFLEANGIRSTDSRRHIQRIGDVTGEEPQKSERILPPAPRSEVKMVAVGE